MLSFLDSLEDLLSSLDSSEDLHQPGTSKTPTSSYVISNKRNKNESPGAKNDTKDSYKNVKKTLGVRPGSGKATTFSETNYQVPTGMLGNDKFK